MKARLALRRGLAPPSSAPSMGLAAYPDLVPQLTGKLGPLSLDPIRRLIERFEADTGPDRDRRK
jgi:hypothetical protein